MRYLCLFILLAIGCTSVTDKSKTNYKKNIRFNHLYVVIDDSTFNNLFDCMKMLDDFSYNKEQTVHSDKKSWTGKYLFGRHQYLEIFNPTGDKKDKIGELGLAFRTDKLGTLNAIRDHWNKTKENITYSERKIKRKGKLYPWFNFLSLKHSDSLRIFSWLMESPKEELMSVGFNRDDLKNVISWDKYAVYRRTTDLNISADSVEYNKSFNRITQLHLTLTQSELESLKNSLSDFGFTESDNKLISQDITINYKILTSKQFVLNQIDFDLACPMKQGTYYCNNIEFKVNENSAHLRFMYDNNSEAIKGLATSAHLP
ncbi:DUF5829 family protein [Ancylomarina sp. YFZ004]